MNAAEKLDTVHISLYHEAKTSIFIVYICSDRKSKDNSYSNCPYIYRTDTIEIDTQWPQIANSRYKQVTFSLIKIPMSCYLKKYFRN